MAVLCNPAKHDLNQKNEDKPTYQSKAGIHPKGFAFQKGNELLHGEQIYAGATGCIQNSMYFRFQETPFMPKYTIAIAMGGFSPEAVVSLKSAKVVYQHLNRDEFEPYLVRIDRSGWFVEEGGAQYPINRNDFSAVVNGKTLHFDAVFMAVHGTPGEDGVLQGYFDLVGIPYTTSGVAPSALGFTKSECNAVLKSRGLPTSPALIITSASPQEVDEILGQLTLPVFVKPNRSGSSFGVSRVDEPGQLAPALEEARRHDFQVVVEEMIPGIECACGVVNFQGVPEALTVTEIVPKKAFFDFEAKYEGASEEVTPARFPAEVNQKIQELALLAYRSLGLDGIARIDFIVRPDGQPVLLEVNTVPGFSEASIVPQQALYAGYSLSSFFGAALKKALKK